MQYLCDPGILPSSANYCILGKVSLRSNISRKHAHKNAWLCWWAHNHQNSWNAAFVNVLWDCCTQSNSCITSYGAAEYCAVLQMVLRWNDIGKAELTDTDGSSCCAEWLRNEFNYSAADLKANEFCAQWHVKHRALSTFEPYFLGSTISYSIIAALHYFCTSSLSLGMINISFIRIRRCYDRPCWPSGSAACVSGSQNGFLDRLDLRYTFKILRSSTI